MTEVWQLVDDERRELVSFMRSLHDADWEHDSLCVGWRNREVLAHLCWVPHVTMRNALLPLIGAFGNLDRMTDRAARRIAKKPVADLLDSFEATVGERRLPPSTTPKSMLVDLFIHHQDMRRSLGRPRHVDEERLRVILEQTIAHHANRSRGITVRATDMVFEQGNGPVVEGLTEALIMSLAGRKPALTDLSGTGFEAMAARLAS